MVLFELEEISPLVVVLNFSVQELGLLMHPQLRSWFPVARSILVSVSMSGRKPCLPPPLGGSEMAREGCELVNEVSNGVEGGIFHDCGKWD